MLVTKAWVHLTVQTNANPPLPVVLDQEGISGVPVRVGPGVFTITTVDPLPPDFVVSGFATASYTGPIDVNESLQIPRQANLRQVTIVCESTGAAGIDPVRLMVEIKVKQ